MERRPGRDPAGCGHSAGGPAAPAGAGAAGPLRRPGADGAPHGPAGADAADVHLGPDPPDAAAEGAAAGIRPESPGHDAPAAGQSAGRVRPDRKLPALQRHHGDEPPAPQRQPPDDRPGRQHPEPRQLDLRVAVGADDVPSDPGAAFPGAGGDGRLHAPLLQDHRRPRHGRPADHGGRGGPGPGAPQRRGHCSGAGPGRYPGQRPGKYGSLLRLSGNADGPGRRESPGDGPAPPPGAAAGPAQRHVAAHFRQQQRLVSGAAGAGGEHPLPVPGAPAGYGEFPGALRAHDADDRKPGIPGPGSLCPGHRRQRGAAGPVPGDALCPGGALCADADCRSL